MRLLRLASLALTLLTMPLAQAAERILSFHSDITLRNDATLQVTETIRVLAEGKAIKRGIYRDFPTLYTDRSGSRHRTGFEVVEVRKDGVAEAFRIETLRNGKRVYIGRPDVFIDTGEHEYSITYHTTRQLGFFGTHDELYWNVTGNGWQFPIDQASASVTLPAGAAASRVGIEAYTGKQGERGGDYAGRVEDRVSHFSTTRRLGPEEGLTIVVTFPTGLVTRPDTLQRVAWFVEDNAALLAACMGLLVLLIYYTVVWLRVGKDPATGIIIPRYEPPKTFSPASMRFIREMGYDHKTFAAAIINLAVKGHLRIVESDGDYVLESVPDAGAKLAAGEAVLIKKLFHHKRSLPLRQSNHERIAKAISTHQNSLEVDYEKIYFSTNKAYIIPGILISALTLGGYLVLDPKPGDGIGALFIAIWLFGWTSGALSLAARAVRAWRYVRSMKNTASAIGATTFAIPFLVIAVGGVLFLADSTSAGFVTLVLLAVLINWAFYHWMKSPTRAGRQLLDVIEGFRSYLDVAEKDELELKHPPQKTPALFEAYLPYALALDVEQSWADKFAGTVAASSAGQTRYSPRWYQGNHWNSHRLGSFTSSLSAGLSASVAAASTAPGSSSGTGGGGSSGGGGGGGGGGGW